MLENAKFQEPKLIIQAYELRELLPHGAGIDCSWDITEHLNGNVTAKNSFHAMNEVGYYDGYMPFTVRIFRVKKTRFNKLKGPCEGQYQIVARKGDIDFKITCNENKRASFHGLTDYLYEVIGNSLEGLVTPMRTETLTEKEVKQWSEKT